MPAIIGPLQIFNMSGGIVHYGDTLVISPKESSKSSLGSGSSNTGPFIVTYTCLNTNTILDSTGVDQPIVGTL
ncbi:spore germination protein [Bacillus sp. Hm123]|uniref:spore germination protein n=1 Tax=Bacillus sp. Hm123 TaxID=3450745 RepID=UPI003F434A21